ncbi:hypothetical protein Y956_12395, partial [Nipponia nippon]
LVKNPKHIFLRVFLYPSQLFHPSSILITKYLKYCRNQV